MNINLLHISGYTLEVEITLSTKRVATYIRRNVSYKRRIDLEPENGHMIVIDIQGINPFRVVNLCNGRLTS